MQGRQVDGFEQPKVLLQSSKRQGIGGQLSVQVLDNLGLVLLGRRNVQTFNH